MAAKMKIPITKALLPYRINVKVFGGTFRFELRYNEAADLFTIALIKGEKIICIGPLIYNVPIFKCGYRPEIYPPFTIVATDESEQERAVTYENFENTVFLIIDCEGETE